MTTEKSRGIHTGRGLHRVGTTLLVMATLGTVLPLVWLGLASVKSPAELNEPLSVWFAPTFENWQSLVSSQVLPAALRSATVGLATVLISLVAGSTGAYAISRYKAGGDATRFGILIAQVLPPAALVFPFLTMAYAFRVNDTLMALTAAHLSFVLPVVTWFLIGFFDSVPVELEEQAQVDGLGRFQAFRKVVLPQVYPGIGAAAIFGFTLSWNDMFYALILVPGKAQTLPVAIAGFNTFRGLELGGMSAAILVSVIPVVIGCFFIQKRLVNGIGGGAIKG